jgi:hypothetical protein
MAFLSISVLSKGLVKLELSSGVGGITFPVSQFHPPSISLLLFFNLSPLAPACQKQYFIPMMSVPSKENHGTKVKHMTSLVLVIYMADKYHSFYY